MKLIIVLSNYISKLKFYFRKKKKVIKRNKKWTLNRVNLTTNLNSIKLHNDRFRGKPLLSSILNRGCLLSKQTASVFIPRLESYKDILFYGVNTIQGKVLNEIIEPMYHSVYSPKFKKITSLYIHDLTLSYKGWRHYKGLPVRGQRTWANARMSKLANVDMRLLKSKILRSYYKGFESSIVNIGVAVESYNKLWYKQWYYEWWSTKIRRLRLSKGSNKVCVYDFNSIVSGRVIGYQRQAKPGKKKRVYKSNYFTLGFTLGSTKKLISAALKRPAGATVKVGDGTIAQILLSSPRDKKKVSKKMSSAKKKQDKLAKQKKKKEAAKTKTSELRRIRDQKTKNLKKAQR